MNKVQLRSACRDARVKGYSKMTVMQMRSALPAGKDDDAAAPEQREEATAAKLSDAFLKAAQAKEATPANPKKTAPAAENVNGKKRPKTGGACAAVWDWLDKHRDATLKDVRAVAEKKGWNVNNAACELYAWRRFNGVTGRVKK